MILKSFPKKYSNILVISILIIIFILPLFVHLKPKTSKKNIKIRLPRVVGGDEPHYLIIVASIIKDLDFDLTNNYRDGRNKVAYYIGKNLHGKDIDHHTYFIHKETKEIVKWGEIFSLEHKGVDKPYPILPHMKDFNFANYREYPSHPLGMPLIVALFTWPFVDTKLFETAAIFVSTIASLIGFIFLYKILFFYSKDKLNSIMITSFFAFGTPLWHYSRSLFTEPFVFCFTALSLYALVKMKNYFLCGLFLVLSFFVNHPTIIFLFLIAIYVLIIEKKRIRSLLKLFSPFIILFLLHLICSYLAFGEILKFPMTSKSFAHYWHYLPRILMASKYRFFRFLFYFDKGLFIFSPFILFAFLGLFTMFKRNKKDAILILSLFFSYLFCLTISFVTQGHSFSGRQMIPFSFLLSIPMLYWYRVKKFNKIYIVFYLFLAYSIVLNTLGSFGYNKVFAKNPLEVFSTFF